MRGVGSCRSIEGHTSSRNAAKARNHANLETTLDSRCVGNVSGLAILRRASRALEFAPLSLSTILFLT